MKILLISDLEGRIPKGLKKFIKKNKIEAIISAGDFSTSCTKMIFKYWDLLGDFNDENMKKFDKLYGFKRANRETIKSKNDGVKVLKYLNSLGLPIYLVFGNQDYVGRKRAGTMMKKGFISPGSQIPDVRKMKNLIYVHNKSRKLGDYYVVGFNNRFLTVKKPNKKLFKRKPIILVTHGPPKGCKFGKIRNKSSPRNGEDVGSLGGRKLVNRFKPFLNVTGHMHEHWGWQKIGKTTVVASGFGYGGKAVLLELKAGKINMKKIILK
jgi:Icc-related predicted phosphoesterase